MRTNEQEVAYARERRDTKQAQARYAMLKAWQAQVRLAMHQATRREIARGALMPHEIDALGALGKRITATIEEALAKLQREYDDERDHLLGVGSELFDAAYAMLDTTIKHSKRVSGLTKAIDAYQKAL